MRLFKVMSEWPDRGPSVPDSSLYVSLGSEGPGVYLTDHFLPVSKALAAPFLEAEGVGAEQERLPLIVANINEGVGDTPTRIFQAARQELEQVREGSYYGPCLVYVCLPRLKDCPIQFLAGVYGEKVVTYRSGQRVEREYLPIEDAGGVRVLVWSEDHQDALIEMLPGAGIRLHRDEHFLPDRESPVLVVSWSGKELRVFRPTKFKDGRARQQQRRQQAPVNDGQRPSAVAAVGAEA